METDNLYQERFPNKLLALNFNSFADDINFGKAELLVQTDDVAIAKPRLENLAEGIVNLSNLIVKTKPDTLVLLDKSARPVSTMLQNLWREIYPDFRGVDIRFVNVGQEALDKDFDSEALTVLRQAHKDSMVNKKVLVADEVVITGNSIERAKILLEKVFPETKNITYTSVFRDVPVWYQEVAYLGVRDNANLPFETGNLEPDNHISKTIPGVIARHPKINTFYLSDTMYQDNQRVNKFRGELSYFSKKVAGHCQLISSEGVIIKPQLSIEMDSVLNKK